MKSLVSGATFHDFEKKPVFIGVLGTPVIREKDGKDDQKAGDIMGYNFTNKQGDVVIIGNSHAIGKAVELTKEGAIMRIEFKGKTTNSKGQPVNMYKIDELDDQNEWDELEPDAKSNADKLDESE